LSEVLDQSLVYSLDEVQSVEVGGAGNAVGTGNTDCQVLGHFSVLNSLNGGGLQGVAELLQLGKVVELGSVEETSGPSEDGGDGVGGGLSSLLVLSVVPGDGSVGSFGLDGAIRSVEDGGHESEGSVTCISQQLP
jgi:hypothetical protein